MSNREFNRAPIVAEKIRDAIDECQSDYPNMPLSEIVGILETLKLELFIEQRTD